MFVGDVFLYMYLVAYEKEAHRSHCSPEKQSLAKTKIAQNYISWSVEQKKSKNHHLQFEKIMVLIHLYKFESPLLNDARCQVWLTLAHSFEKKYV